MKSRSGYYGRAVTCKIRGKWCYEMFNALEEVVAGREAGAGEVICRAIDV